MRTSLNETAQIEQYLLQKGHPGDHLVLESRELIEDELSDKIMFQRQAYHMIREYGRSKLKAQIKQVDQHLFELAKHRKFRLKILSYFK